MDIVGNKTYLSSDEFYSELVGTIGFFSEDIEQLAKMLVLKLDFILSELQQFDGISSDDCSERKRDIHNSIDSFHRIVKSYCENLKSEYEESFNKINPLYKLKREKILKTLKEELYDDGQTQES